MKKLLLVLLVMAVTLTVGCVEPRTPIIADISTQDAFTMIQDNQDNADFFIIDVRTPDEFDSGHLENATNLNYRADNFSDEINNLDKDKTYLIYCAVGGRSSGALTVMGELGFMEVYNMLGGINQWKAEELPTTK